MTGRRWLLTAVTLSAAALAGVLIGKGTPLGYGGAFAIALAPLALYAFVTRPFLFPLAGYAFFVPLNDISLFSSFGTLTKVFGSLTLAAFLIRLILLKRFVRPPRVLAAWALLVLYMIASLMWANEPGLGWPHISTLVQLIAVIAILALVPAEKRDVEVFVIGAGLGGIAAASFGLYQYAHGIGVAKDHVYFSGDDTVDPNQFAATLLLPAAILTMGALRRCPLWQRLICIVGDGMVVATIAVSGSRGAAIAIVLMVVYFFIYSRYRTGLTVVTAAMGAVIAPFVPTLAARFAIAAQTGGAGRTDIWKVGLAALRSNALFGAGFGNFGNAYDAHFLSVPQPRYEGWHRASHSVFVGISVELGLVGLALLIVAIAMQALMTRDIVDDEYLVDVSTVCGGALLGILCASIFLDVLYTKPLWLIFAIAMVARAASITSRSHAAGQPIVAFERLPGASSNPRVNRVLACNDSSGLTSSSR